jgi:hypothetical protein
MQPTATQNTDEQNEQQQQQFQQFQQFQQQPEESQFYVSSSASQFPHIVSALLAKIPSSIGIFGNQEYVAHETLAGSTAPCSVFWKRNETGSCTTRTQYQSSTLGSELHSCYETNKCADDENVRVQEGASCGIQGQVGHHMSAFASDSAQLRTDQSDPQFPETRVMEQLCQAGLRNDHNQPTVPTDESHLYSAVTAQLSLLDLENPLEELFQNMDQNNTDNSTNTNTLCNPSTFSTRFSPYISINCENRDENVSTLSPTPRFCQL